MRLPVEFEQQLKKTAKWLIENKGKKLEELDLQELAEILITEEKQPEKEILEDYWADDFIEPITIEIESDDDILTETTEADVAESVGFVDSSNSSDIFVQLDTKKTNNGNGNHHIHPKLKEIFEDIESSSAIIDLSGIAQDIGLTREDFVFFCNQHKNNGVYDKEAIKAGLKKEAERYLEESQGKVAMNCANL